MPIRHAADSREDLKESRRGIHGIHEATKQHIGSEHQGNEQPDNTLAEIRLPSSTSESERGSHTRDNEQRRQTPLMHDTHYQHR